MSSVPLTVRCRGRWPEILNKLAGHPDLQKAIDRGLKAIARSATPPHGPCPVHGGKHGDAFRIFKNFEETGGAVCNTCGRFGTGFNLLMWINGWDELTTGRELRRCLEGERPQAIRKPPVAAPAPTKERPSRPITREYLMRMWNEAVFLTDEAAAPVRRYFAHRGLAGLDLSSLRSLRCHPRLRYTSAETIDYFAALLAYYVDPRGELVAVHRTYLTEDGQKAPVEAPKKLLKLTDVSVSGGCVRLTPIEHVGSVLCTGEGLENALTGLLRNPRHPFWPATSAALFGGIRVPAPVRHVVGWEDFEPPQKQPDGSLCQPGKEAAKKLAHRLLAEGRTYEGLVPPSGPTKMDWNKMLLRFGIEAIPKLSNRIRMLPTAFGLARPPSRVL